MLEAILLQLNSGELQPDAELVELDQEDIGGLLVVDQPTSRKMDGYQMKPTKLMSQAVGRRTICRNRTSAAQVS